MGRKTKKTQSIGINNHQQVGVKRKKPPKPEAPPAKRKKDDVSYPGKFVLLKPPMSSSDEGEEEEVPTTSIKMKNDKKQMNGKSKQVPKSPAVVEHVNGEKSKKKKIAPVTSEASKQNNSQLARFYNETISESEDDEWMSGELETDSMSDVEVESCSEKWSTDTDFTGDEYSQSDSDVHSFHESDCMSVSESESDDDEPEDPGYWEEESEDDSDYKPEIEDKYVKQGEAILYDAKGLDLAFGDSTDSRIIEVNDIQPAFEEGSEDEEVPELVDEDGKVPVQAPVPIIQEEETDDSLQCSQLSNHATFFDCHQEQGVVVQLRDTIHFHGVLIVRPLVNKVQINGYTLETGESLTVSSISRADYFLNLTPVIDSSSPKNSPEDFSELLDTSLIASFNPTLESLVHLQQGLPDTTLDMLKTYSLHPLLPNKKMLLTNSPCPTAELRLAAKFFVANENEKVDAFTVNEQWKNVELKSESRLVVIGGKNVGKSTLSQFLVNQNVCKFKKILLIDLDIGQPICGAAQTISATVITRPIVGPGYLSDNTPVHCLLYGDKNVMTSPFKYVRCVKQLMTRCSDFHDIPWIVNTMGYQKGFGLQLMSLLLRILQPTDVVQVQHSIKSYNFSTVITESVVNSFEFSLFDSDDLGNVPSKVSFTTHVLDSIVNNRGDAGNWISNSTDKRKLLMIAQLSRLLRGRISSLNDVTPLRAPIAKLRMVVMDEEFSQSFNIDLLNGSLVYLCYASEDSALDSTSILECFGVGIVRGIDKINEQIYILLPQSKELQVKVNVLAIGNIPLPAEILLKQSYSIAGSVPHVTFFRDRNASSQKYINKKGIKDCY
jgi:polynucleotide 5'-hydroxyl-kinase GRC3/NOL9